MDPGWIGRSKTIAIPFAFEYLRWKMLGLHPVADPRQAFVCAACATGPQMPSTPRSKSIQASMVAQAAQAAKVAQAAKAVKSFPFLSQSCEVSKGEPLKGEIFRKFSSLRSDGRMAERMAE